jgi:hypothetical protein
LNYFLSFLLSFFPSFLLSLSLSFARYPRSPPDNRSLCLWSVLGTEVCITTLLAWVQSFWDDEKVLENR